MSIETNDPYLEICAAIGECLHAWGLVESELSDLFMILHSRSRDEFTHPLRAAFESVVSFEARLSMIKASVDADCEIREKYSKHWVALHNKLARSYKQRHEVAHFVLISGNDNKGTVEIKPFFTWASFKNKTGKPAMSQKLISDRKITFFKLQIRIQQHKQNVGKLRGLPPEFFAQAGDLVHPDLSSIDPSLEDM